MAKDFALQSGGGGFNSSCLHLMCFLGFEGNISGVAFLRGGLGG
jgi:hypothetical protein